MEQNPRYYRSVRIVPKKTKPVERASSHLQYAGDLLTGRVSGRLTTLQPLHVGTGQFIPPESVGLTDEAPLIKAFHRSGDSPTIPGSSLKGPVRSIVEMITYSAVSKTTARLDRDSYGESIYDSRHRRGELDIAGRLFGAMGYQGHIHFADCPLISGTTTVHDIPPQYQPRGSDGRRYYPHELVDPRERLWPLEVVAAGSVFEFTIRFTNLTTAELGLLLIPLGGTSPPLCIKLGAGKAGGLGAVRFDEVTIEQVDAGSSYTTYETSWVPIDGAGCVTEAVETLIRHDEALERLQHDLGCNRIRGGVGNET
jgi:CRISPR/Cas system CSM-associated protein Csm3 (group 7 of RAMP superfamily)